MKFLFTWILVKKTKINTSRKLSLIQYMYVNHSKDNEREYLYKKIDDSSPLQYFLLNYWFFFLSERHWRFFWLNGWKYKQILTIYVRENVLYFEYLIHYDIYTKVKSNTVWYLYVFYNRYWVVYRQCYYTRRAVWTKLILYLW